MNFNIVIEKGISTNAHLFNGIYADRQHSRSRRGRRNESQAPWARKENEGTPKASSATKPNADLSKVPCRFFAMGKCTSKHCKFAHSTSRF